MDSWLFDYRTSCWSVQTTMSVRDYLALVQSAHATQGAISGQRSTLATTTAKRIRDRMIADLVKGAVLPPVVLGVVVEQAKFDAVEANTTDILEIAKADALQEIAIIDGMQRTAALLDAVALDRGVESHRVRVEFWLTTSVRAMVYRMLVLNTGQVPWTISRQLSVVYAPLLGEVEERVDDIDRLIGVDDQGRRVSAAQYRADSIVELYMAFSLRKSSVDTREQVSDEFSRLDFVDNVADESFQDQFYRALGLLARLDKAFARYDAGAGAERFSRGRHIFDSQPARIGFIVAIGVAVLGRPGANRDHHERGARLMAIERQQDALISRLSELPPESLGEFLALDVLREVLDRRVGQVGRYERAVFGEAFKVLLEEEYGLESMEPCWRAE